MSALFAFLNSGAAVGAAIGRLLWYGWRFLTNLFLPKAALAARVLAAESQLAICQERLESQGIRRYCFSDGFRWLWVLLAGCWEEWQRYGSADATGHSQTLAGVGIWTLLALEILSPSRTTGDFKATAGAHPSDEPGES